MAKMIIATLDAEGTSEQVSGILGAFLRGLNESQASSSAAEASSAAGDGEDEDAGDEAECCPRCNGTGQMEEFGYQACARCGGLGYTD